MMSARVRTVALSCALLGWAAAQTPGSLPRSATLSGSVSAALTLAGLAVGALVGVLLRHLGRPIPRYALAGAGSIAAGALAATLWWQSMLRSTMGMPPIGVGWIAATVVVPAAAAAAVTRLPWRYPVTLAAVGAAMIGTAAAPPASAAPPNVPSSTSVHYSYLADAAGRTDQARARELVAAWTASGGLDRRAVVIAVPTGSGWVDASSVEGFEQRFGGSVRVLALQYSAVPSWQAFVRSPERAGAAATALLDEVVRSLATRSPASRPALYLYGQSLGALGADTARRWALDHRVDLAGTVLVGVPGGAPASAGDRRLIVVNNDDDPVAAVRPSLLWQRPPGPRPWLPGLSALATVVDLAGALDVPTGHGHRYGTEQGLRAPGP